MQNTGSMVGADQQLIPNPEERATHKISTVKTTMQDGMAPVHGQKHQGYVAQKCPRAGHCACLSLASRLLSEMEVVVHVLLIHRPS